MKPLHLNGIFFLRKGTSLRHLKPQNVKDSDESKAYFRIDLSRSKYLNVICLMSLTFFSKKLSKNMFKIIIK